jgi:hypothetical protein
MWIESGSWPSGATSWLHAYQARLSPICGMRSAHATVEPKSAQDYGPDPHFRQPAHQNQQMGPLKWTDTLQTRQCGLRPETRRPVKAPEPMLQAE